MTMRMIRQVFNQFGVGLAKGIHDHWEETRATFSNSNIRGIKLQSAIEILPGTSFAKNPGSHLRICWPYRVALRNILRRTYPRPSLPGTTPSLIRKVQVRAWSATTRSATSSRSDFPYQAPVN